MTTTSSRTPPRPAKAPVLGALTRAAACMNVNGAARRLLILLAAYGDAGEHSPPARELARRLGIEISMLDPMLKALIAEGVLRVRWRAEPGTQRNVYELKLAPRKASPQEEVAA
jgi:hypothetical protein